MINHSKLCKISLIVNEECFQLRIECNYRVFMMIHGQNDILTDSVMIITGLTTITGLNTIVTG